MTTSSPLGMTVKIVRYQARDVLRSRWLLAYTIFFALATDVLLRFVGARAAALLSVMNVVLLVVPLIALIFGTLYLHQAREFIELLLAQPIARRRLFVGLYLGLALPLTTAFVLGLTVPATMHAVWTSELRGALIAILGVGAALTAVFTAIALCIAVRVQDKVRGFGAAIGAWLVLGVLYDGLVLLLATIFADYPLEQPLLALMLANPIDLARVVLLLQFDASALMGYTGAVFERFFTGTSGPTVAFFALLLWTVLPAWLGMRAFQRKDL